jgi:hypothetical protein
MVATTAERVAIHTTARASRCIDRDTEMRVLYYGKHPEEIPERMKQLDREWDIERALETGSSSLTLLGLLLGATVNRKWFLLSLGVQGFFLQHSIQGWCPPLPLMRNLGIRTVEEIEAERCSLKKIEDDRATTLGSNTSRERATSA